MSNACKINCYRSFCMCDERVTRLEQTIELSATDIVARQPLPSWPIEGAAPVVSYYDGEILEFDYRAKHYILRHGDAALELDAYPPGEGPKPEDRIFFHLSLSEVGVPKEYPALREMRNRGSMNSLVRALLPTIESDKRAAVEWVRIFSYFGNAFLLNSESIELIRERAEAGSPMAQFAYGRTLLSLCREENYAQKGVQWLERAFEGGVADAAAALYLVWYHGDADEVDRTRADNYLEAAISKGSSYAASIQLLNLIYGKHGVSEDPQKAVEMANQLIERDETEGIDPDPMWYFRRGCAIEQIEGPEAAVGDFERAAELGASQAWSSVIFHYGCNNTDEVTDRPTYLRLLREGTLRRDNLCLYLTAREIVRDWPSMPPYTQMIALKRYLMALEEAWQGGSPDAADCLGDIWCSGEYDLERDTQKAALWYERAMKMGSEYGCEMLFELAANDLCELSEAERDRVALKGARLGSARMMYETLCAFYEGRLREYAVEIERYYAPFYEELCEEFYDDELPDDDGRYDPYV